MAFLCLLWFKKRRNTKIKKHSYQRCQNFMKKDFTKPFQWLLDGRYRLLFHLMFWVFVYLDELLSLIGITPPLENPLLLIWEVLGDVFLVYFNLYVLLPWLLLKNKVWRYLAASLALVVLNVLLMLYLYYQPPFEASEVTSAFISTFVTNASILAMAVGVKIFKIFIKNRQRLQELQYENLQTEITFLKNQINPHFLFNALNNIHVLSRKNGRDSSEAILQLSDLLRYQIYDCSKDRVPLKNEIEYLENYLALDKLRKNKSAISFELNGDVSGVMVAPFLFIPFVENAIKHGANLENQSRLKISFNISPEKINFHVENQKPKDVIKKEEGGIGLANVKRRLELLYPEQYDLSVKNGAEKFIVDLTVPVFD